MRSTTQSSIHPLQTINTYRLLQTVVVSTDGNKWQQQLLANNLMRRHPVRPQPLTHLKHSSARRRQTENTNVFGNDDDEVAK